MQRIKKVITCFLTVIVLLSVAGSANAMKSYYMKISSNTLPTAGCTAIYAMLMF